MLNGDGNRIGIQITAQELHAEVVYGVFLWPIVKYFVFILKQRYQCGCILSNEFGVGSFPLCHTMGSKLKHRYFRTKTDLKDRAREREVKNSEKCRYILYFICALFRFLNLPNCFDQFLSQEDFRDILMYTPTASYSFCFSRDQEAENYRKHLIV